MDNWNIERKIFISSNLDVLSYLILYLLYNQQYRDLESILIREYGNIDVLSRLPVLNNLQNNLYIRIEDENDSKSIILTDKSEGIFKTDTNTFEVFWDKYHKALKMPKTDKEPALKKWKKLSSDEKSKAISSIPAYTNHVRKVQQYAHKARTYLEDKLFNNEYSIKPKHSFTELI